MFDWSIVGRLRRHEADCFLKNENYMRKILGGCNGACMWCDGVGRGAVGWVVVVCGGGMS